MVGFSVKIPAENRKFSIMVRSKKVSYKLLNCYVAETTPARTTPTTTTTTSADTTTTGTDYSCFRSLATTTS